jgi:hypothetical protein
MNSSSYKAIIMNINVTVILASQFSNIWEGPKPASLTYEARYTGDDELFQKTYDQNLTDEVAMQVDFWGCVSGYDESYSVEVRIGEEIVDREEIKNQLTQLVLGDMKQKTGKNPENSFNDRISPQEKKEFDDAVARAKREFPWMR